MAAGRDRPQDSGLAITDGRVRASARAVRLFGAGKSQIGQKKPSFHGSSMTRIILATTRVTFFSGWKGEPRVAVYARSLPSSPLGAISRPPPGLLSRPPITPCSPRRLPSPREKKSARDEARDGARRPSVVSFGGFASPPRRRRQRRLPSRVRVLGDARRLLLALPRGVRGLRPSAERRLGVFVRARHLRGVLRRHAAAVRLGPWARLATVRLLATSGSRPILLHVSWPD